MDQKRIPLIANVQYSALANREMIYRTLTKLVYTGCAVGHERRTVAPLSRKTVKQDIEKQFIVENIQRIIIHYRFVGYLEMEQDYFEKNIKQDTRQGVAVEYVPKAASE